MIIVDKATNTQATQVPGGGWWNNSTETFYPSSAFYDRLAEAQRAECEDEVDILPVPDDEDEEEPITIDIDASLLRDKNA